MYFAFLSGGELIVVLIIVVVLFGATRIPQLGEALGKGIHNFRKSINSKDDDKESPPISPRSDRKDDKR